VLLLLSPIVCLPLDCANSLSSSKPKGLDGDINDDETATAGGGIDSGNADVESSFAKKSSVSAVAPVTPAAAFDVTTGEVVKKSELSAAVEVVKNASLSLDAGLLLGG
jgi:hypothetical protein